MTVTWNEQEKPEVGSIRVPPIMPSSCYLGLEGNEPFGSRPEPGAYLIASTLLSPPGEVPEGRARGDQDTATQAQSESEL